MDLTMKDKRYKESREVMGSWGSYPWKQDIQEDWSSQDTELDFQFPVTGVLKLPPL